MKKERFFLNKPTFNLKRKIIFFDVLLILVFIFFIGAGAYSYLVYGNQIKTEIFSYGLLSLFIAVFLIEIIPSFLNPHLSLIIASPILGVLPSFFCVFFASLIGSIFGFVIGRKYGANFVYPLFKKSTLHKISIFWDKYGKWFVFFSAFTPLPYIPVIFGAMGMERKQFFIFGVATRLVSIIVLTFALSFGISLF